MHPTDEAEILGVLSKKINKVNNQVLNNRKQPFTWNRTTPEGRVGITFSTHYRDGLVLHERHEDLLVAAFLLRLRQQRLIDQHLGEAAAAPAGGLGPA